MSKLSLNEMEQITGAGGWPTDGPAYKAWNAFRKKLMEKYGWKFENAFNWTEEERAIWKDLLYKYYAEAGTA